MTMIILHGLMRLVLKKRQMKVDGIMKMTRTIVLPAIHLMMMTTLYLKLLTHDKIR